jgi:hypothetical protein
VHVRIDHAAVAARSSFGVTLLDRWVAQFGHVTTPLVPRGA